MLEATKNKKNNNNDSYVFQESDLLEESTLKNIYLRADGRYMIHYQLNKKRKFAYSRTKKQAELKLKKLKKLTESCEKSKTINYTLEEWNNYWLATYKEPFIQLKNYNDIKHLIDEINSQIGHYTLDKLNTKNIQEFYNTYKTSRKKEKLILYLNASLTKALETNVITANPCKAVVKDRKLKFEAKFFNIEEQEQIIQAIKGTDIECYIYLYILSGIRLNEINMNIEDWLNLNTNQLKAVNEKQRSNITSYKYIDLAPEYAKLLYSQKDKFILSPSTVYRKFKKLLEQLGIEGKIHTLRHTFATNYYYLGVPEKVISAWMGHSTTNITRNVYIGVERQNFIERLNKLYNNLLYKF